MNSPLRCSLAVSAIAALLASCSTSPPPPIPPVKLPRGGKVQWNEKYGFWDRNGDGKADRIRNYWGSGYAREYFDDDFDGTWDGAEHAGAGRLATGLKEKRIPEGLTDMDRDTISRALEECIQSR